MRGGIVLIGEIPFDPSTREGKRLAHLMGVASVPDAFACVSLVDRWPGRTGRGEVFPNGQAKRQAEYLWRDLPTERKLLLVGRRVAHAFALSHLEYLTWTTVRRSGTPARVVTVVPHPRAYRWWSEPTNAARAARFLRRTSEAARERGEG